VHKTVLPLIERTKRWLLVVAAPVEARAVIAGVTGARSDLLPGVSWKARELGARFDIVITGVGKANASAGVARALDAGRHAGVINAGVGGAMPEAGVGVLDVVVARPSIYADEGMLAPEGFRDIASMGFPPNQGMAGEPTVAVTPDERLVSALEKESKAVGPVATVSTCSATEALAREVRARTGAIAEAMEGAAAGFTVQRLAPGLPFVEVRVVSNMTGDRSAQGWDLAGSTERLRALCASL